MKAVYFMGRVKRTVDGTWDKGIEIKEAEGNTQKEADDKAKNMAYQSFHAYLGAYAYGKQENVDYVHVSISSLAGLEIKAETWNNIVEEPVEEIIEEPTEEGNE